MSARILVLAACAAVALLASGATKAHAEYWDHDGWRERHERQEWREREWRERQWREHEWREHHRYYGG